jgi:hypothetical protein
MTFTTFDAKPNKEELKQFILLNINNALDSRLQTYRHLR